MVWGTSQYVRGSPAADPTTNYLQRLSGAMANTGATIGATGGLNFGDRFTPYQAAQNPGSTTPPALVPGPSNVSGNAVPNPDPNATLAAPLRTTTPTAAAPVTTPTSGPGYVPNLTPNVPYASTPFPQTVPSNSSSTPFWTMGGGFAQLTPAGAQNEATMHANDPVPVPMLQGVPLTQIMGLPAGTPIQGTAGIPIGGSTGTVGPMGRSLTPTIPSRTRG